MSIAPTLSPASGHQSAQGEGTPVNAPACPLSRVGARRLTALLVSLAPVVALAQPAQPITRVGVFTEHSDLDRGYADWRETTLRIQRLHAARRHSELALARTSRFGLSDTQIEIAHAEPLSSETVLTLQANASPTHRVLPRYGVGLAVQHGFAPAWVLHAGARYTRYSGSEVERLHLMLERYVGDFSHSLQWAPSRALGQGTNAFEWRSTWHAGEGRSIGVIASVGEEAAEVGGGAIAVADVRALALVARWRLGTGPWALTGTLSRTRQGTFYTRNGWGIGVQRDF